MTLEVNPPVSIAHPFSRDPTVRLNRRSKPRRVEQARRKHRPPPPPVEFDPAACALLDRIFSLPSEIRTTIYYHLLVQPTKWDLTHRKDCDPFRPGPPGPRTFTSGLIPPAYPSLPFVEEDLRQNLCAYCRSGSYQFESQSICVSPARSQWAPPHTNPFLCDLCYAELVRSHREPCPPLDSLSCLCARRRNLSFLLLNRQIHREAGFVFWTENCFSFEKPALLIDFMAVLRPEVCDLISRVSLMTSVDEDGDEEAVFDRPKVVVRALKLLGQCRNLMHLELDEAFLSHVRFVRALRGVKVGRSVIFVRRSTRRELISTEFMMEPIWGKVAMRSVVVDSLAEQMAWSMSHRRPLTRRCVKRLFERRERMRLGLVDTDDELGEGSESG
ncbi:uncharacterized protein BDW47DRAFT_104172 [Aspergillus candidus]|uniref:Uncharacterized protein n=1 Tax=Aspergillus candidus TaxID=41067 RepID=A0A2I2FEL8_ASPCN|nr:hypothetical protein BDW47DRAFT_104172 [Aspergillus candidus]PLB39047.1 hypothetical protein BDW47DRAFT_104172 [Aspergillus candidus]